MPPQEQIKPKRDWSVFLSSVFFVLGFSVVFSVLGILIQTIFSHISVEIRAWVGYAGGIVIILFGLFLLRLIRPAFLMRDHKIAVKKRFGSYYITSFVFGAAFAAGWTPCVTAALGAILALASTDATSAFLLLVAYTLGIGLPFLLVGLFVNQATVLIEKAGKWLKYVEYVFGVVLIGIGILVFTGQLGRIANFEFIAQCLLALNHGTSLGGGISSLTLINTGVAFFAGLASFLSPCILPIIPGFLSYLASTAVSKNKPEGSV